ncbi:MAG TPA: hypothetical protein VM580_22035, partial [Labilithrix sp.]|nr:hypothetical protein [Labilithrix sp.]
VHQRQEQLLKGGTLPTPIADFKLALTQKAEAERGPLVAELATKARKIRDVRAIIDRTRAEVEALRATYATIVEDFKAYRDSEPAATAQLIALAEQSSQTTLATVAELEQHIATFSREESTKPDDLVLRSMRLAAALRAHTAELTAMLGPHRDFMKEHGAEVPDMTSAAVASLDKMVAYCQQRRSRTDEHIVTLSKGLAARREALVGMAVDETTRETFANAGLLKASAIFLDESNQRIAALWRTPPKSTTMNLPYLTQRYDDITAFLQLEPLCSAATADWRETGCIALRRHFATARSYQKATIPILIRAANGPLRTHGAPASALDEALVKLTAGDVKAAVVAYDEALRASEGLVSQ